MSLRFSLSSIASFAVGALFGIGLVLAGMHQPKKIQDFLDVAGPWDPSLLGVMAGALLVTFFSFPLILRRRVPVLAREFHMPAAKHVDAKLVVGAALFGIGWGLGGFCPGPALVGLGSGARSAMIFVGAMLLGMMLHRGYHAMRSRHARSKSVHWRRAVRRRATGE